MAQRNQWSPSRSLLLTINKWRRLQAKRTVLWLLPLLSSYILILFRQDAMYVTAIVHARGSSTSLWYNLSLASRLPSAAVQAMLMQSHHEIFCQALGPVASVRLIPNIFWNTVPVSASSTRTSLHALPALLTARLHRKILHKTLRKALRKTLQQLPLRCHQKAMLQHSAVAGPSVRPGGTILGRCASGAF